MLKMPDTTEETMLTDLGPRLISGSLSDAEIQQATEATLNVRILPWANVVKIGGQSIMDRGRSAVFPLTDEIVANLHRHKMILGTGAGTRARPRDQRSRPCFPAARARQRHLELRYRQSGRTRPRPKEFLGG